MASERAVYTALKLLSQNFAGTVDPTRVELWMQALDDMTDDDLRRAVVIVIRQHTGEFIPPVAVIRAAVAPAPTIVDHGGVIRQIEKMAVYSPEAGMIYPVVPQVEQQLGRLAAYAYAAAGARDRLFSDNQTTRDIATRDFQRAYTEGQRAVERGSALPILDHTSLPSLPKLDEPRRITRGNGDDDR